jgi:hypothetical protein
MLSKAWFCTRILVFGNSFWVTMLRQIHPFFRENRSIHPFFHCNMQTKSEDVYHVFTYINLPSSSLFQFSFYLTQVSSNITSISLWKFHCFPTILS